MTGGSASSFIGSGTATEWSSAVACRVAGWVSFTVTRVTRVPISVTSSAVTDVTPGGSEVGTVSAGAFPALERSTTNESGVGL